MADLVDKTATAMFRQRSVTIAAQHFASVLVYYRVRRQPASLPTRVFEGHAPTTIDRIRFGLHTLGLRWNVVRLPITTLQYSS